MMSEQGALQFFDRWEPQMMLSTEMAAKFKSELIQLFSLLHAAGKVEGIDQAIAIVGQPR